MKEDLVKAHSIFINQLKQKKNKILILYNENYNILNIQIQRQINIIQKLIKVRINNLIFLIETTNKEDDKLKKKKLLIRKMQIKYSLIQIIYL